MDAVGDLAGDLERPGAAHGAEQQWQPFLNRAGEREQPGVFEELAVEVDGSLVEEGPDHLVRLDRPGQRLGPRPVDVVLREQTEVAAGDDALGAPAGELVERGHRLRDERRLAEHDTGQTRAEADRLGLVGGSGEQQPHVLVPGLVRGVAAVETELVRLLDGLHRVGERVVRQHHVTEPHAGLTPSSSS